MEPRDALFYSYFIGSYPHILGKSQICYKGGHILLDKNGMTKFITVYPAMRIEPVNEDTIFISDQQIKYAKPFAVKKIVDAFGR